MGERLFSPKSLARVAEAVEWEDVLTAYRDGTTNQEQYMKALAILWERWMRGWALPDFANALIEVHDRNFLSALRRILRSIPERISQLKGFYEGLWYGANPGWDRRRVRFILPSVEVQTSTELAVLDLQAMLDQLRTILFVEEEETNE